jgi:hypothetical protein
MFICNASIIWKWNVQEIEKTTDFYKNGSVLLTTNYFEQIMLRMDQAYTELKNYRV